MRKFLKTLKRNVFLLILIALVTFLMSFFITDKLINTNYSYYVLEVDSKEDLSEIFNEDCFCETVSKIIENNTNMPDGWKYVSIASIDYKDMINNIMIDGDNIYILYKYFPSIVRSSNGTVNEGSSRVLKYISTVILHTDKEATVKDSVTIIGYTNPYIIGLISAAIAIVVFIATLAIICICRKKEDERVHEEIEDNVDIFKHPFKKAYWQHSKDAFKKVKNLTYIAILFALMIVCKLIILPSGFGNLGISFTYIIFSIISLIYGPICGIVIGLFSDVLGYFLFQSSEVFFFGYTLSAMLSGFIYGISFYRTKVTFAKCLAARILVNFLVNVFLGTIWWSMIYDLSYDAAISYMMLISLPKNIVYLLPQSIVLFVILKALARPLSSFGLVDAKITDNITLF